MKRVYELDGNKFNSLDEFYEQVSQILIPGLAWGKNLDAFNDILRGGFGTPSDGFVLRWKNASQSREKLGYMETVKYLERKLAQCHPANHEKVKEQLLLAQKGQGQTLFDILVEIIQDHGANGDQSGYVELELM